MAPPNWAVLERELIRANSAACEEFFKRYFDERGYLMCVERWGGDDGPDDAIENLLHWPLFHALGGPDRVLEMYKKAWEGHLRQYTEAKTVEVPFARDGMYYREFPCMFDWLHNAEGLVVFSMQGLSDPNDEFYRKRVRRFAGFYLNDDPQAPNYDPKHKIIRSMFNGSRGPLLRKATGLDWAGDPIEVEHRFSLGHGERNYSEMVAHFKDYNDIIGDHPQNLLSTSLAFNAFATTHEKRYRDWILEYCGAWRDRMIKNGNIIPSNIGLDGKPGSAAGGKWYGGVYGWSFTVEVPQTGAMANRNTTGLGLKGLMNAFLMTGDRSYINPWREQIKVVNSNAKVVDGKKMYPAMYGDDGWYAYSASPYTQGAREIFYCTLEEADRKHVEGDAWLNYLRGRNANFPETSMRADFASVRKHVAEMKADKTTPDTRLADDPMQLNPCSVQSLGELMMGALYPGRQGLVLHARLRYFDADKRRAGIPDGVAALIDKMTQDATSVTLVNTDQLHDKTVIIQGGGYGEHQILSAETGGKTLAVNGSTFKVKLAAGCGAKLNLKMKRYTNTPTLLFPWDR
ncbi:MAG: hypothetical protein CMJ78_21385 [Planctomycetaceae bacterium]|nr:hypothetical protein [Planctomycetaceae bacterium]